MMEYRWSDLSTGLKHRFAANFTLDMVMAFAELSGDSNPLHCDRGYALNAGHPDVVVHGMLTASLYSRLVGVYLPGKFALLQGIHVDFNSPCYIGEQLVVEGEIVYLTDTVRQIEIKATIRRQDRKLVSKATIKVGLHAE